MKRRHIKRTMNIPLFTKSGSKIITSIEEDEELKLRLKDKDRLKYYPIMVDTYRIPKYGVFSKNFTEDAIRSIAADNAGGKSWLSEALSINYFMERFGATKVIIEMEIEYWINYKMCDFICNIKDKRVGVSVTRAMQYSNLETFTLQAAYTLLHKKLHGLVIARNGVSKKHEFYTCALHVWCQTKEIAELLRMVYPRILSEDDTGTIKNVIVILSICDQEFIYTNEEDEKLIKKKEVVLSSKPSTVRKRLMRKNKREIKKYLKLGMKIPTSLDAIREFEKEIINEHENIEAISNLFEETDTEEFIFDLFEEHIKTLSNLPKYEEPEFNIFEIEI